MSWDAILKGSSGADILNGGSGDDFLQGKAGGDTLDGGDGNDQLHGDAGDDHIRGGRGDDFINGGIGTDTAYYSGSVWDYSHSFDGENLLLNHVGGSMIDGNDRLLHVERLVFADAVIDLTINNAPIAFNDTAATNEDVGTYNGSSVLANDFDWEGDALSALAGTFNGAYGTLVLSSNGTYTYTPHASSQSLAQGQVVQDVFTYTVTDGNSTDTGTLTVNLAGVNDAPVANPDSASGHENEVLTIAVLANDTDVDNGAVLTVTAASAPSGKGTASVVGNQVQFDPGADFDHLAVGASELVVLSYTISDELGATSSSTVDVVVTGTNDGPVASSDTAATDENSAIKVDVLANDSDIDDGAVLTVAAASAPPGKGTASIVGNQVKFEPGTAFDHLAAGVTEVVVVNYTIQDEHGASSSSTLTIAVTGTNDAPVANPDTASTGENAVVTVNVLANDTDADDGAVLSVVSAAAPSGQGTATVLPGNQVQFDPGTDFDYLDTGETAQVAVAYTIEDQHGAQSSSTVTVTVSGANDAPIAVDDTAATNENDSVSGNVLANDTDVDGETLTVNPATFIGAYGTLVLSANGDYTYTPSAAAQALVNGQVVNDVFNYTVKDGTATDAGTLTITVTGLSGVPAANDDTATTTEDANVSGNVLANDTDAENDPLTVANPGSYNGLYGTLTLASNGSYTYTPNAAANALSAGDVVEDVFTYTASDGTATDDATLTIAVNGVNDAPTIDAANTDADAAVAELPDGHEDEGEIDHSDSGTVAFDDVDASDSHAATFTALGGGYLGTFTLDPVAGSSVGWDFTVSDAALENLSEGEIRTQTYAVEIADGNGGTVTQNVTVTITGAGVGTGPQTVWFIDNSTVGTSANLGTSADPYTSIAAFNAAQNTATGPLAGHTVYLRAGTGTYAEADGINLLNGQTLIGVEDGALRPTIVATAGDGINVAQNNTIAGVDVGNTSGADIADSGGTVGTLTISDVGTSGTGQVIDIDQGGTLDVTLNSAESLGSSGGAIDLAGVGGSFTVTGATTITGLHSGGGIDITGSSVAASFAGGGTVGTLTGTGVNFVGNSGSLAIGGGLDIVTTSGAGLNASGGGTVTATGSGNSITSTTGTALSVVNSAIGAAGLTFESISSTGAVSGIVLANTGAAGGLTVTGDASSAVNGSGGTIAGSTGAGISLTNTSHVSLDQITVQNGGSDGINGTNVVNFSLTNSSILGNGNADEEHGIDMTQLTGTATIDNSVVRGSFEHNFRLLNSSGTLDSLAITDSTFDHLAVQSGAAGGNGILITLQGSAVVTDLAIVGSTFRNNFANAILVNTENSSRIGADNATSGSTDGAIVADNIFDDNNIAIQFGVFHSSDITVDIENNTIVNDDRTAVGGPGGTSTAIVLGTSSGSAAGSTLNARVEGNVIGDETIGGSGSSSGSGISLLIQGLADVTALIDGNSVRQAPLGFGIEVQSYGSGSGTPPASDVTITDNDVDHTDAAFFPGASDFPLPAIWVYGDSIGTAGRLNLDIRGNTVPSDPSYFFLGTMIEVFNSAGDMHLVDNPFGPSGQTATEQLETSNTGTAAASGVDLDLAGPLLLPPDLFWP